MNLIRLLMMAAGTTGLVLMFRLRIRNLPAATVGALLSGICLFLLSSYTTLDLFFSNMMAAMLVCIWSELMARVMKAPANLFEIPGIIPLLPGGRLYETMAAMLAGQHRLFWMKGIETLKVTVGIASGIIFPSIFLIYYVRIREKKGKLRGKRRSKLTTE